MIEMNLQMFGGRGGGSGMSSSTSGGGGASARPGVFSQEGTQSVQQALGMSATEAADNYWDKLRISASEKYAQAEGAAESLEGSVLSAGTHAYDVVRTQGGKNNPDLVSGGNWKTFRNDTGRSISEDYAGYLKDNPTTTSGNQVLYDRMTSGAKTQLDKATQASAQKWLRDHPRPKNPRKEGYKWDGTKYVRK